MTKQHLRLLLNATLCFSAFFIVSTVQSAPRPGQPPIWRGEAAIRAWQAHLPAIAQAHGKTVQELTDLLRRDRSLGVDQHGQLLYTDQELPAPEPGDVVHKASASDGTIPVTDTFLLHSRPGAARIIYLDFDGHVLSGTAWNANNRGADIICPPFDFEGGPDVFTDNEKIRIQQIWKRVAEDYAPFDVDVTTEYMGEAAITRANTSDVNYGMRVLISPISSYFGNYGGIAYIGVFNAVGDYYKPALVFPDKLGPNGEKYVAEAASHETGHTLGLTHDGTTTGTEYYTGHGSGDTGWAPIMGSGYYKNITQWSKGEYANANNAQDDLSVIASYLGYRPDDRGDGAGDAFALPRTVAVNAVGLIESTTDVDVFSFQTGAGIISLTLAAANPGPNLDMHAELFDQAGTLVGESLPAELLGASINIAVNAGTYYLRVGNSGYGTTSTGYSCYGSLGQYTLTGTLIDPTDVPVPPDIYAPSPSPMSFAAAPSPMGPTSIGMTATTASDANGVEYYFACVAGGGHDSGWQISPTYTDVGLTPGGTYTYQVLARDRSGNANMTVPSEPASATTPVPAMSMGVQSISLTAVKSGKSFAGRATVYVYDNLGKPVAGATITGQFTGSYNEVKSAITDKTGKAVLTTTAKTKTSAFTFCVQGIRHATLVYDSALNVQTCASR